MAQLVVVEDHRIKPVRPETSHSSFRCLEQRLANATTTPVRMYRETIEMSAPPVPPSDDRTDQLAVLLSHEQRFRISLKQRLDHDSATGASGWTEPKRGRGPGSC